MQEIINSYPDFTNSFSDKRIGKRANRELRSLTIGRNSSIRQITRTDAEQKSFYRLFNNESFKEEQIIDSIVNRCGTLAQGRHLLCIQDTVEFNLSNQRGRIKPETGLGNISKEGVLGFILHSSMVVNAHQSSVLGYSYIKVWQREENTPNRYDRKYQQLPIEKKESYRWIEASEQSKRLLKTAEKITIIADRESDIYELLAQVPDTATHLLIRSSSDRKLKSGERLNSYLAGLPVMSSYSLEIKGDVRKKVSKRTALINLKWGAVELTKPSSCINKQLRPTMLVNVVEAKEQSGDIHWRIITTHPVSKAAEAIEVIEWYKQRWHIEQMHRLLKTQGFRIESSQLEQGWAIRKLTLLGMMATLRVLQMMLAYEDNDEQDINEVFTKDEQQCLQMLNEQQQGTTQKLKNNTPSNTLKWATWIIARLGGWKGYTSVHARKPGPIVLQKGLANFYQVYEGWKLYKNNFNKIVSSQ